MLDDEAPVRKATERLLRSAGMDVEVYATGAEFLAALATSQADCLILDLQMPDLNGFEIQDRINASGSRLPVVIVTGNDTPEARARAMAAGSVAVLLKPVHERELLDAIALAIAGRAAGP